MDIQVGNQFFAILNDVVTYFFEHICKIFFLNRIAESKVADTFKFDKHYQTACQRKKEKPDFSDKSALNIHFAHNIRT